MKLATTIARSLQTDLQAELRDLERAAASGTKEADLAVLSELLPAAEAGLIETLAPTQVGLAEV
jgi:hypothetical protein